MQTISMTQSKKINNFLTDIHHLSTSFLYRKKKIYHSLLIIFALSIIPLIAIAILFFLTPGHVSFPDTLHHVQQIIPFQNIAQSTLQYLSDHQLIRVILAIGIIIPTFHSVFKNQDIKPMFSAIFVAIFIFYGPSMLLSTFKNIENQQISHIHQNNKRYVTAQKMVINGMYAANQDLFRGLVKKIDKTEPQSIFDKKVMYILDTKAFGHPVSEAAKRYYKEILQQQAETKTYQQYLQITLDIFYALAVIDLFVGILYLSMYLNQQNINRLLDTVDIPA